MPLPQDLTWDIQFIMASPSKVPRSDGETVVGHLHCVSPMKMSKNSRRYFEATLQTRREEFNRVVCFSPEKRYQFIHAADNRQAVKLVATRKSISKFSVGFPVFVSEIGISCH